ncbi:MAG: 3-deoxy-D-manno-octulosonic acid kinase [Shewanella sp.]|nr:3-deoxy-D-manno-octulosonic acid kinase [Shewanella sp.]
MQLKNSKNISIAYSNPSLYNLTEEQFTPQYYQQKNAITGSSSGRQIAWFLKANDTQWVLRHYWRGGFMAKLSKDLYCFSGARYTRPMMELGLLEQMYQFGLPVPRPIAAKIERRGLFYRGDILIERIENADDLVKVLSERSLADADWQRLGKTIAIFHNYGVYHADLNIKNILLQKDKFYLIDFDRGEMRTPRAYWQKSNIARLKRSFAKEQKKYPKLQFTLANWQTFLTAYQQDIKT